MGKNEPLDSPIMEPLSSGALTISDTEIRLRRIEELLFSAQTVDQKTTAKLEEKPIANTVQADNNKDLDSTLKLFMWSISLFALIIVGIAVPAHYSLSNKIDNKIDALSKKIDDKVDVLSARIDDLIKTVSDMRVDIGKLQVFTGQSTVSEQQKSPASAETKGEAIPDQNSR
jgi:hypothetical protein